MSLAQPSPDDPNDVRVDVERRFADMDLLGHVNNVRYLDYLEEGRASWMERHDVAHGAARVEAHRIGFVSPMVFGRADAEVRTSVVAVDDDRVHLAQTVLTRRDVDDQPGTVHLRAETWLRLADRDALRELRTHAEAARAHEWREVTAPERAPRHAQPVTVRARDVGPGGAARDDAVVEWFQESRVRYFMDLHTAGEEWGHIVVARTDVDLAAEVRRGDAVEVRSWIAHLGTSSFSIRSDLVDAQGDVRARATVVAVCFDAGTQRPAPMTAAHRAKLEREVQGSAG